MHPSRWINFSLVFVMAAYLPLWICCATHAASPEPVEAEAHGCCSTKALAQSNRHAPPDQHQDCTCTERASAAFVNKTLSVSFEPVQPQFDLLPGALGKVADTCLIPAHLPQVPIDASPPGTGPLLDQFCLLTT